MSPKIVLPLIILFSLLATSTCNSNAGREISMDEAVRLHQSMLTIDSHTDTPLRFSMRSIDLSRRSDPHKRGGKLDFPRMQEGVSDFGRKVIAEMNRLGIMIDVSHMSDEAFDDVLALSKTPVIASHSNARAVCNNPRNLSDEMLLDLAENGGVIQLCLVSDYIVEMPAYPERDSARKELWAKYDHWSELDDSSKLALEQEYLDINEKHPPNLANVSQFCDHFDHVVNLVGIDHVGFGSDYDGGAALEDCFDVTELPNITHELLNRGY